MNDHSPGWQPDLEGDGEHARRSLQRAYMDRARRAVEREGQQEPGPRRLLPNAVALVAALVLALGMVYVFAAFLGGVKNVLRLLQQEETRQQQEEEERRQKEPIPAYVVPSD
jgi:uncharacterized protein HemX